jgi:peptide/nickel transport system permease protein
MYGFDRPVVVQYFDWLWRALHGNFGWSYFLRVPVESILLQRLPVTLLLGVCSITFALLLAIPLGIAAALRPNSLIDRFALVLSVVGQAMPSFWFALILISTFSVAYPILPVSGSSTWQHFVLPTIVLGYYAMPAIMRLTRSGMIDVLDSDYIRTARSKGLSSTQIVFKHALRNAIVPVVSLAAAQFGFMLAGSVVVETVFAIQGAGRLAWESILRGDIPTMQAVILVFSLTYVLLTLTADLLNAWLNPRVRLG